MDVLTTRTSIDHRFLTPYHPQGNGLAERYVRTLKEQVVKTIEGDIPHWDIALPMVQLQMNTKVASLHGSTPFSLFFGRSFAGIQDFVGVKSKLLTEEQLLEHLKYLMAIVFPASSKKSRMSQKAIIDYFNKTHRLVHYPNGAFVMARHEEGTGALESKYEGPFMIVRRTDRGSYVLRDSTHQLLARNYAPDQLKLVLPLIDPEAESSESFEVERVISDRLSQTGETLYMVKWKGYDDSFNSEIPFDYFDSKAMVANYHKKKNEENNDFVKAKHVRRHLKAIKKIR